MTEQQERSPARERRSSLSCLLIAATVLLILYGLTRLREASNSGAAHPGVGARLQGLALQPLIGTAAPLQLQDFVGKTALINFWGPWCGPCRMEMPHLIELQRQLADVENFQMVSVSCGIQQAYADAAELREETRKFAADHAIQFPVYFDPGGYSRAAVVASAGLDGFGYPTTVLVDRQLVVRGVWVGYSPGMEADVEEVVHRVLSEARESS